MQEHMIYQKIIPEGRHKIQDNYKSELFMVVSKHKDPNVYIIHPLCRGPVYTVN